MFHILDLVNWKEVPFRPNNEYVNLYEILKVQIPFPSRKNARFT